MFVTKDFVYIHQPKTGGTFVAALLKRIHEARGDRVEVLTIDPAAPTGLPPIGEGRALKLMLQGRYQHGRRAEIPLEYRDRPVLATIRNPYDRYVSQFEFAWWRQLPEMFGPIEEVRKVYPRYPDLTFEDFVRLTNAVSVPYRRDREPDETPGFHTQQFIEYFSREPDEALARLSDDELAMAGWESDLRHVCFVNQAHLNTELHAFLLGMGYSPAATAFVVDADRIWPPEGGRPPDHDWRPYYSPALKTFVRRKERLLFRLFPQFDV